MWHVQVERKMPRKTPELLNRLDRKQMWKLTHLVQEEYAARAQSDTDFAKYAEEKMQLPLTQHNVAAAREILDMPSTAAIRKELAKPALMGLRERMHSLEAAMLALQVRVRAVERDQEGTTTFRLS
jgi:hypothetical protein